MERLIICGGGHVALALAQIASILEFDMTVIDDRPEFANAERFPMAQTVLCKPFSEALDALGSQPADYYVIASRGHASDRDCLERVLRGKYAYVGMIGSKVKIKAIMDHLRGAGISRETLEGVHAPIGLPLGGQRPAEVAVSIAAELVRERAQKGGAGVLPPPGDVPGVLAVILKKSGSAPRGPGAWMLVQPDGTTLGTIGGGSVEHEAVLDALDLWKNGGAPIRKTYDLSPNAAGLGMVCGGRVDVEFTIQKERGLTNERHPDV